MLRRATDSNSALQKVVGYTTDTNNIIKRREEKMKLEGLEQKEAIL